MIRLMRTTLDIDDGVLPAVKKRARRERLTVGQVISALARRGLSTSDSTARQDERMPVQGFRPFPRRGALITNAMIDRLRDDSR
jgi:hypothetical protein